MKRCYKYYRDPMDLVDGRPYKYVAKVMHIPREYISLIFRGKRLCTYDEALALVNRFDKMGIFEDYFERMKGED